ncbi:farnesyl pyrophosphate synthase-like [Lutzomyia longipalpis]|uniref:farnesyl pyrophosphate synthase-like n=1 Tax=Lutzomyia longipalpis TaxID=7200 RepID=UPI0024837AC4|nr:farnesyl pyrophosphate synthase-like [Lutzomyia longipalpis]
MYFLGKSFVRNLLKKRIILNSMGKMKRNFCVGESGAINKEKLLMSHYPRFEKSISDIVDTCDPSRAGKHIEEVLDYTTAGGKKTRGKLLVAAFEEIAPKDKLTEEMFTLAAYLGWCVEAFHGLILIMDDIMDGSLTRRGQTCWYRRPNIQMSAINDAVMLDAAIYEFLHEKFHHLPTYADIIHSYHRNALMLYMGQYLDVLAMQQDVLTFTMEQCRRNVIHKGSHYTIYSPIELAYNLAGYKDLQPLVDAKDLIYEMGIFFQAQDDFLDCYGDPKVMGKIGTDIEDGKCTWLVATFLSRANEAQKDILKKFYGKNNEESVTQIKKLYEEVGIFEAFKNYEDKTYKDIKWKIQEAKGIPKNVCQGLMDKLYKRNI